jgi:hypothetical protein
MAREVRHPDRNRDDRREGIEGRHLHLQAGWSYDHRTSLSTSGLHAITELGSIQVVVGLTLVLAAIDFYRTRSRWSLPFLLTVMAGMELLMHGVKDLVGRVRPALDPAAAVRTLPKRPFSVGGVHAPRRSFSAGRCSVVRGTC